MKIKWMSWANGILGLLLLTVPFTLPAPATFGYSGSRAAFWNSVIVGVPIATLSFWEAWNAATWSTLRKSFTR